MPNIGDYVFLNDKGKNIVRECIKNGHCDGPMPETLGGQVVTRVPFIDVCLPLSRRNAYGQTTYTWSFMPSELIQ
jgi:hypothetical protein